MKIKFYKCTHCGNVIVKTVDSGVPVVCCGEPMQELSANKEDAAVEKHVPAVTVNGDKIEVVVGDTVHPMMENHYIQFICLETEKDFRSNSLHMKMSQRQFSQLLTESRALYMNFAICMAFG